MVEVPMVALVVLLVTQVLY
jgi:hypothetical protein